jgi:methylated-DNA-[protein]-cysteine S-methyltransferase
MMDFTTVATPLGIFTLIADDQGLAQITLPGVTGPRQTENNEITSKHPVLQSGARQITEYTNGQRSVFDLPLHPHGTEFQQQVWEIIKNIPYGRTLSYGEIARKLGDHKKARAVGGAANANPLPLVIPCHRVIGSNGSLTGFAGGLNLKEKLLQLEQKYAKKR